MISKDLILQLRSITQAGMNDCTRALKETNGDLQKAIDLIKARNQQTVSNTTMKETKEGVIVVASLPNSHILVECNCQTDFVARTEEFYNFAFGVASAIMHDESTDKIYSLVTDISAKTKEVCRFNRFHFVESVSDKSVLASYDHNKKIGVIVEMELAEVVDNAKREELKEFGENLAMQVAAMNPIAVSQDSVSDKDITHQKEIFKTQLSEMKKKVSPEQEEKILQGKFQKWYGDVCLLNQKAVWNMDKTISELVEELNKTIGFRVVNFYRMEVGA